MFPGASSAFVSKIDGSLFRTFGRDRLELRILLETCSCTLSNKYQERVAEYDKECYGGKKQGLNMSLTLEIIKTGVSGTL